MRKRAAAFLCVGHCGEARALAKAARTRTFVTSCLAAGVLASTPSVAFADHMGSSGFGAGGGMTVLSPETLDEGHAGLGFRISYTRPHQRSDAELEELAGTGIHAHNTDYNLSASIGAAYGITHQLTVSAELPYVRRDHLREAESIDEVVDLGNVSGLGDLSILAKYRLFHKQGSGVALIGGIKAPTGSTHRRSGRASGWRRNINRAQAAGIRLWVRRWGRNLARFS